MEQFITKHKGVDIVYDTETEWYKCRQMPHIEAFSISSIMKSIETNLISNRPDTGRTTHKQAETLLFNCIKQRM